MNTKQTLWVSALAAAGASLCCAGPLVLVGLGISGAWIATLTQLEPLRPLLLVATLAGRALAIEACCNKSNKPETELVATSEENRLPPLALLRWPS